MDDEFFFVDSHVHLYREEDTVELLDAARKNFLSSGNVKHLSVPLPGILMLANTEGSSIFSILHKWAQQEKRINGNIAWQFQSTAEPDSLAVYGEDGSEFYLLNGWQCKSREHLEVLTFACPEISSGLPIKKLIEQVFQHKGLAILPWGAGKWLGSKGKEVSRMLELFSSTSLILGDNGGRPTIWSHIPQFRQAEKKNIKILRGSDPLPLPGEHLRVGSFGNMIPGSLNKELPAQSVLELLRNPEVEPEPFGKPLSFRLFMRKQVMLRLNKSKVSGSCKEK